MNKINTRKLKYKYKKQNTRYKYIESYKVELVDNSYNVIETFVYKSKKGGFNRLNKIVDTLQREHNGYYYAILTHHTSQWDDIGDWLASGDKYGVVMNDYKYDNLFIRHTFAM